MLAAPLLDSSGADKGPQFAVGEVVNGEYRVRSVEADEQGKIIHKCSRLSNGENVIVCYNGRNGQLGGWPSYQSSSAMPFVGGAHPVELFEVQFGNDMFAYVVYAERMLKDSHQQQADFEREKPSGAAPRSRAPRGARFAAVRKGDCELEVDIPCNGFTCTGICTIGGSMLFVAFACVFACIAVLSAFAFSTAVRVVSLFFMAFLGLAVYSVLLYTITAVFGHENLTITPEQFKIKRNLELIPRRRDSMHSTFAAAEELTCLDELFCNQASGETRNLWKAEMKISSVHQNSNSNHASIRRYLALMEGVKAHTLGGLLSDAEKDWIAQEINEVLQNIKQVAGEV